MKTLKERYESKQIEDLSARLPVISESMREDALILEAFDKAQMAAAIDIIKKLKTINFNQLESLKQARDVAVNDVNRVLGGQRDKSGTGVIRTIINLFKNKDDKDNPLIDALAFSSALNNFFSVLPEFIDANLTGSETSDDESFGKALVGLEPSEISTISGVESDKKKKLQDISNVIINSLKPEGTLAKVGISWLNKYMKGKKGLQSLANELIKMSVKNLKALSSNITSTLSNVNSVGQAAVGAAQQAAAPTTKTSGSEQTTSSQASTGTKVTEPGTKAPGGQVVVKGGSSKRATDIIKTLTDIKDETGTPIPPNAIKAIVNSLDSKGMLK